MVEEETSTKFIHFDQVRDCSRRTAASVYTPHIAAGWRYLTMHVATLHRAAALPSIAIYTFESLTINHCTSLLTSVPPPSLVRPHENDQSSLTRTKCQICPHPLLLLLRLLLLMVLWVLVLLHRLSGLQRERGAGAVEGTLHPSRRILAEDAYSDRRNDSSFVLSIHPFPQASSDQSLSLSSQRTRPQEMATSIIYKEDACPSVR